MAEKISKTARASLGDKGDGMSICPSATLQWLQRSCEDPRNAGRNVLDLSKDDNRIKI